MNPTVIDTLRYADRLKAAGVEPGQAEAMSRALNAELTEGLVTKSDLDAATAAVKSDLDAATVELKAEWAKWARSSPRWTGSSLRWMPSSIA